MLHVVKNSIASLLRRGSFYRKYRQNKWRKANLHNFTEAGERAFDFAKVKVGKGTYGVINLFQFDYNSTGDLTIGNFCSIAPDVSFLVDGEHAYNTITTYPFQQRYLGKDDVSQSKGSIVVEDDVWIGYRATILSGVRIGQGAIIAAGAVVTKDVPPYAIVGGVPAKVLKYRFPQEIIEELMKVDYSKLDKDLIQNHVDDLYRELVDIKQIEWMPRKK